MTDVKVKESRRARTARSPKPTAARRAGPADSDQRLGAEHHAEMMRLLEGSDSVELKVSVRDADRRSAVASLGMDPLDAQMRQVVYFDTPDLRLDDAGVVVRARRVQGKSGDSIIKLRPVDPAAVPPALRRMSAFGIELDAMPNGYVCSGRMKMPADNALVRETILGRRPVRKLFAREQRDLFANHAPAGVSIDDLAVLGPINVMKLKFTPEDFPQRIVAELWFYPEGQRILELSTKCTPSEAFDTAARTRTYLMQHGIDLLAEQQTKTRTALEFFADELAGGA